MRYVIMAVAALVMFGATPTETQAQEFDCGECKERWHEQLGEPIKEHKIPASEASPWSCGDGFETLTFASGVAFTALGGENGCHGDYQDGSCIAYPHNHGACPGGGTFTARMAQIEGDEVAQYALLATTELRVARSEGRTGVSVMDCDGLTPIANIPLSEEEVSRLLDSRASRSTFAAELRITESDH